MVKISASPHFPRLLGRTPNAFQIPPRPLDWRTGTSHSSRTDSPPPLCLPVLPNEDKWVHSPPIPGITLYLTVVWYKADPPCCRSYPSSGCPHLLAIILAQLVEKLMLPHRPATLLMVDSGVCSGNTHRKF